LADASCWMIALAMKEICFFTQGLKNMKVMPGAEEMARFLDSHGVPRGLITRNVKESVAHFHTSVFPHKPFNPALARCFTPPKPSPASLLHICSHWGIEPHEVVMVGDSPADDIACGNAAGATTILIDYERRYDTAALPAPHQPMHHVHSMHEVRDVLQQQCRLSPPVAVESV
jgi:HAD superfamily hydrolase (TIGR01549 family)